LTLTIDDRAMAAIIHATDAPGAGVTHATHVPFAVPTRREGQPATAPGEAARELDVEVARLLRVRGGELAEPLLWGRPSHRREVDVYLSQLAPIRSRIALLSSWEREAHRGSSLRLAYAMVWLLLAHRRAAEYRPRKRPAIRLGRAITARG
jgi:hypothetical protein